MLFILFSFIACSDYIVHGIEKREQDILVYPEHINFGHLVSGQESEEETFTIINTGDDNLVISAPVLVSGNTRFQLVAPEEEYTIPSGELLEFQIVYTPKTFEANGGYIEILSNDPDESVTKVTLEGYGDAPVMTVSPQSFDYGDISIGCDNEERITITNDGNMPLVIESVTQMVTQPADILMEFGSLPEPPWQIDPGFSLDFLVSYIPTDVGYDESQIEIKGNDPSLSEVQAIQYGDGDVEQWFTQTWQQEEIPVLDVLWVIDNSGSMGQHQANLATNINSFISTFAQSGADYNMAVITTDRWTFGTVLTPQTPNIEQQLANLITMGTYGSGMEKGIQMSYQSLDSSAAAGPGGTFFREDAILIVIYVSDEPDHSVPDWSSYINFFDNIKPPGQFIPYGVIADAPNGCQYTASNGAVRTLQPGWGYWDIIDHYNGSWYSICATDWGVQLQDLAGEVTGRRSFLLEESDPIQQTIEVTVNGQVSTSWEYDESSNSVIFADGSIPDEGQTIVINYAVWGCEE